MGFKFPMFRYYFSIGNNLSINKQVDENRIWGMNMMSDGWGNFILFSPPDNRLAAIELQNNRRKK